MDIRLDQGLDSRDKHPDGLDEDTSNELMHDDQTVMSGDVSAQQAALQAYQFCSNDNGQVTYRVVQVAGADDNQQATLSIVTTNGIQNILTQGGSGNNASPQVAIVANTFNNEGEGSGQTTASETQPTKFAYFPSSNTTSGGADLGSGADSQDHQNVTGGQFYVMMSPQDMIQTSQQSRSLVPRNQFVPKLENNRNVTGVRDSTRRIQHNEVERRRRDKINNWIMKLSKLVPDCAGDNTKQGQSKGGILAKTCDYILDLQTSNQRFADNAKEYERIQIDYEVLRLQLEEKKQENNILRQMLQSHGIEVAITSTSNQSSSTQ